MARFLAYTAPERGALREILGAIIARASSADGLARTLRQIKPACQLARGAATPGPLTRVKPFDH